MEEIVTLQQIRNRKKYLDWKKEILERDENTCKKCGLRGALEVHHIKEMCKIISEEKIKTISLAMLNKKMWDKDNAITLCSYCHKEQHGYS